MVDFNGPPAWIRGTCPARFCAIVYVYPVLVLKTTIIVLTFVANDQMPCKMFGGGEYTVNMMIPKVRMSSHSVSRGGGEETLITQNRMTSK